MKGCSEGVCSGACCAVFPLNDQYRMLMPKMASADNDGLSRDHAYILDMLIPLTVIEARERQEKFAPGTRLAMLEPGNEAMLDGHGLYTCRHWDEETRLCTAYEDRPLMCRAYPYGAECERGCGFKLSADDEAEWKGRSAPEEPSVFEWVPERGGWVIRSAGRYEWDAGASLLRLAPTE